MSDGAVIIEPDLDRLFCPRVVAVVGASDAEGRPATLNWRRVRDWASKCGARAIPVNPNRTSVDGVIAYGSIVDVPEEVDVAVLLTSDVETALRDVASKRAGYAIVFASGFAELGRDGEHRQTELMNLLAGSGVRMLGPNTNMNIFEDFRDLPGKAITLITQSGHQGRPVFQGQELGIRFSHWAPTGNEADLGAADFIRYFAGLPDTGAIAAYLEGFRDGTAFRSAAVHAARRGVPLVVVKVGRTAIGRSSAHSHTGHLSGADDVTSAVFRQYGVIRTDGLDQLLDTAALLARTTRPRALGVCVYSISGGTSAHMADLLAAAGIPLPELGRETQALLREWIPSYLRVSNPVDNGGHPVGDWRGRKILDALVADPHIGVLVVPITGAFPPLSDKLVDDLIEVAQTTDKPVCVVWGSPAATEDAYRQALLLSQLPVFRTFGNCVSALRGYFSFHEFQDRVSDVAEPEALRTEPARDGTLRTLTELEAKQLIERFGIQVTRDISCADAEECLSAVRMLGGDIVLKALSRQITHKSELNLVRMGLRDDKEIRAAVAEFEHVVKAQTGEAYEGTLVCERVEGGVETAVGIAWDEVFGPVVMFGLGGRVIELYHDVTFRVPPFSRAEAHRMIREVVGFELLAVIRGAPPVDLDAIVEVIIAVQQIALSGAAIELDINPLLALPDGAVALDAMARVVDHAGLS